MSVKPSTPLQITSETAMQPQVQVVAEDGVDTIARPISKFMFPFAGQPDIVRSTQKDAFYEQRLLTQVSDLVQEIWGTRTYSTQEGKIATLTSLAYHGLTTLMGAPTLGEEYCGILQTHGELYPSLGRRVLMVLLHSAGGEGLRSALSATRRWLLRRRKRAYEGGEKAGWLERLTELGQNGLWARLAMVHLAVFYFTGAYYGLAKRVTKVRYVFTRKLRQGEESSGYEILGALLVIQLVVQTALQLRDWQHQDEEEKEEKVGASNEYCWSQTTADVQQQQDEKADDEDIVEDTEAIQRFVSSEHTCTLCLSPRNHPAATPCGHMFCWTCVFEWCQARAECPLCRQPVRLNMIMPVYNY
ncbi:peroxisome biogenesis factor 10 [Coemansia brasiliensis]|uniref:RING-type E3 ubiquitin transferase n=1 Tax=Coemansia brasiliensis TaxID=2650707 RepID=A0A9W8ICT1_9FUNG|nr:peroxisome biogenesis factor 10 [Coemansia brasiliensis]